MHLYIVIMSMITCLVYLLDFMKLVDYLKFVIIHLLEVIFNYRNTLQESKYKIYKIYIFYYMTVFYGL